MRTIAVVLTGLATAIAAPVALPQATPPQLASASALARTLTADLTCAMPAARITETFQQRIGESPAPAADLVVALNEIAAAADTCAPVREAAQGFASALSAAAQPQPQVDAETAALASLVSEAFTEADRRAARPVFDSPPPPRNLTRGRISTP